MSASFGDPAGIDNWGTMTLDSTTVSDNHASAVQSNSGGIVDEANATLTLLNSRVVGNSASAAPPYGRFTSGGGIFVGGGGTLTVDSSAIDDNSTSLANSIPHPYPLQDGGTDVANAFGVKHPRRGQRPRRELGCGRSGRRHLHAGLPGHA